MREWPTLEGTKGLKRAPPGPPDSWAIHAPALFTPLSHTMATESTSNDSDDEQNEEIRAIYRLELTEISRSAYRTRLRLFVNYLRRTDPELVLGDDSFDCARLHLKQVELFLLSKQDEDQVGLDTLRVRPDFSWKSSLPHSLSPPLSRSLVTHIFFSHVGLPHGTHLRV
jgi:hypothetical protein